ncbi:uncharacterized protein N0V89_009347 [Didymosphaeria variabile]|uniref:Uncharacterized protein n=1 Tax=Didymosphaeria variabile TaxID=1932322 RepID=A0A9W8XDR9_9PLEO|nr:uncharacterized protein N0V89_009347 [Didymosphaeria variabile]KAJ4347975.1 hypothetical protein N0V89_009347 [Didymosphaeria variabile]
MNMPPAEGMVDLQTLAKIFEVLDTSQLLSYIKLEFSIYFLQMPNIHELTNVKHDDDKDLATWIKTNYLPRDFNGVIDQGGVTINGTEAFAKLYNAYKRVRTLTNRAQDKWPFFDRRWKSMTSAQVTKMATSEHATSSSDAMNGLPRKGSSVPEWIGNRPEATGGQSQPKLPSPALNQTAVDQTLATGGIAPEVTQKPTKSVEGLPTPTSPSMKSFATQPHHAEGNKAASNTSSRSSPTSVLAAEAAPEHSNLDDLPVSSGQKRKRGNPDYDDNGRFARGHGNLRANKRLRGGKAGRVRRNMLSPRARGGSDSLLNDHTPSTFEDDRNDNDNEMADGPVKKPKVTAPSPRVTRRQTRLSKGGDDVSTSTQALSAQASPEAAGSPKRRADSDTTTLDEKNVTAAEVQGRAATPDHEDTMVADNDSATTVPTDADLLNMGLTHSERRNTAATTAKDDQESSEPDSTADTKKQAAAQDDQSQESGVKYFARVSTGTASFEIALDEAITGKDKDLTSDLLGYAAWREKSGENSKSISFDTWRSIFSFGR